MTSHPIIFSGQMVRALLEGRKIQTRRLAWHRVEAEDWNPKMRGLRRPFPRAKYWEAPTPWQKVRPGDRLWVREAHLRFGQWRKGGDGKWRFFVAAKSASHFAFAEERLPIEKWRDSLGWHIRPAIFHPRCFSRLTLPVTATKMERLQAISEGDAMAEGIEHKNPGTGRIASFIKSYGIQIGTEFAFAGITAADAFGNLWESLHGEGSWADNPQVVALTFRVHHKNIDAMKDSA